MITAWRLVKKKRAADAFTGEGARQHGGRWNHPGTSVVYLADSLSLAALETFVHLGSRASVALRFIYFRVCIPEVMIEEPGALPGNWRQKLQKTRGTGTTWAMRATSPVLRVPSVILPVGANYVLNPLHPDFSQIIIEAPEPFSFDPRMWK